MSEGSATAGGMYTCMCDHNMYTMCIRTYTTTLRHALVITRYIRIHTGHP
jgi:hypothetical protein